ncbi:MAG: hypothetical protein JEZ00_12545 [Anaerolineaceae bacterium]|nr:hypothetical protein [Anaerolineaceae bacterium]
MPLPVLATKLFIPTPRAETVSRPELIQRLNRGHTSDHKLTLISAPAGFGKSTLLSQWIMDCKQPTAWLALDEGDNDPTRFLIYLISAIQSLDQYESVELPIDFANGLLAILQNTQAQSPSVESNLTTLLNEIQRIRGRFNLVLDDYHIIEQKSVEQILAFLLDHLPPQMHLIIATREDPQLPLARLRARGQLTELRASDLRFSQAEATEFLNKVMGLNLSEVDVSALDTRTEGWIAGLQLAAISMQGKQNTADLIHSFTGSHQFVLDYLLEEVLHQQSEQIQAFLFHTSILDRLCGPLCDAVLQNPTGTGQETLEYLEHVNLFIVPLDNERRWYRYHHLFAELLKQRFTQTITGEGEQAAPYHSRASAWYEKNSLVVEAFQHATAAMDVQRAEHLLDRTEMPLHFSSVVIMILDWLASLPDTILDARPLLRIRQATLSLVSGQSQGVEKFLHAAETALQKFELDAKNRNLMGEIAVARATVALTQYKPDEIIIQSQRAQENLASDNLAFRFTAVWTLAFAYQLLGDRTAAFNNYLEAISISQKSGDTFSTVLASSGLGQIQELSNQLYQAAETYQQIIQLYGDYPQPNISEVQLGLARIYYEWNDLNLAEDYAQQSLQLSRQYGTGIDRFVISQVFLARLKLARGDTQKANALLSEARQMVLTNHFVQRLPEITTVQILLYIHTGDFSAAEKLAQSHDLPLSQARILIAQGNSSVALALLEPLAEQFETKKWQDEYLKCMVLQSLAYHALGEIDQAMQSIETTLALAESGGFIRTFIDEGTTMANLLAVARSHAIVPNYVDKLLSIFAAHPSAQITDQNLINPLSQRELQVLQLIAQGASNREISEKLFLALDTVKGHNRKIFDKLQVQRRTEAVVRARELGIL